MIEVRQTAEFMQWLSELADPVAHKRILDRVARIEVGLFGDAKPVGGKVFEVRVDHGPGYRVYFARSGRVVVILLCGGIKGSQRRDIARAKKIAGRLI